MSQKVSQSQFSYVALIVFGISGTVLVRVGNQKEAMFSRRGTLFRPGRTRTHADDDEVSFPRGDVLAPRPSSELDLVELRAVSAGGGDCQDNDATDCTSGACEKSQICKQVDVPFPSMVRPLQPPESRKSVSGILHLPHSSTSIEVEGEAIS